MTCHRLGDIMASYVRLGMILSGTFRLFQFMTLKDTLGQFI
jgi:hypothetical protein